jgi:hypothetical protein
MTLRQAGVALVLVGLAGCAESLQKKRQAADLAAIATLFEGCQPVATAGSRMAYRCADLVAAAGEVIGGSPLDVVDTQIATWSAQFLVQVERKRVLIDGVRHNMMRATLQDRQQPKVLADGYVLGVPAENGRVRLITCQVIPEEGTAVAAPMMERCQKIVGYLATREPPTASALRAAVRPGSRGGQ